MSENDIQNLEAARKLLPAGFVIVPEYPTEEMMDAGLYQASADAEWGDVFSSYRDMIQAAQL